MDTLTIDIDSAGAVLLADTLNDVDGLLVAGGTADTRYRVKSTRLLYRVR
ncbi:MAG: hypothetical protein GWO22_31210, partial [Actinobacteria bacterium]|nr:hypothetical protein [Actinomycetota bacterium]